MVASARKGWIGVSLIALGLATTGCGRSATYAYELDDECSEVSVADGETESLVTPEGYPFLCGRVLPDVCVQLGGDQFASLEVESDQVAISYMGDAERLEDTCSEDLGAVILVVSTDATGIPPTLPVFFNESRIEPLE